MKNTRNKMIAALSGLSLMLPAVMAHSTTAAQVRQAITLDPPSGEDLRAHSMNTQGEVLPFTPANFRRLGEAKLGEAADARTLTLRFAEGGRITGMQASKDFRIEQGGSCETGNRYAKDSTCTLLVRFVPQGAGNRVGRLTVATDTSATPMAFGLGGFGYSPIVSFIPSVISTVPGTYVSSAGLLKGAQNLAVDGSDTLYVADTGNNLVRYMDGSGTIRTLASGYPSPRGITVDPFGEVYFDTPATNNLYEVYDYGPVVQINGSTTGASCTAAAPCVLSSTALSSPGTLSADAYNHLFVSEGREGAAMITAQPAPAHLVFLYDPFSFQTNPSSPIVADASDNLYSLWSNGGTCSIVQQSLYNAENNTATFTKIAGGHTCGFAGDGGLAGNAEIGATMGQMVFDAAGDLYFTDTANQRVRRIDYATGVIHTIGGNGTAGYGGDGGAATSATLNAPTGVGVDSRGQVYVISSAASGQVIRKIGQSGYLEFGSAGKGSTKTLPLIVTNTGNSTMVLTGYSLGGTNVSEFGVSASTTTCMLTAGATLAAGQSCQIGIKFTPTAAGSQTATLTLLDNTVTGIETVTLHATGVLPSATMAITAPASGSSFKSGTSFTFSVSVTSASSPAPTGTVQFKVDGANYGSAVALSGGAASKSISGLTTTSHTLSATYSGDGNYAAGTTVSEPVSVTAAVKIGTKVSLSSAVALASACAKGQYQASVSAASGTAPSGTVRLLDGDTVVASGALSGGHVQLTAPALSAGKHTFVAKYGGDTTHSGAVSSPVIQDISPSAACSGGVRTPVVARTAIQ